MKLLFFSDLLSEYKIETPDIKRSLNKNRINEIYTSMLKIYEKDEEPYVPSPITICETKNEIYIIDGNHRFNAYKKLLNDNNYDVKTYVSVIKIDKIDEIEVIFNQLNNSVSVEKMPKGIRINQITHIKTYFMEKYTFFFRGSLNPHRPFVSETIFGETLGKIVERFPKMNHKTIISKIEEYNKDRSTKNENFFKKKTTSIKSIRNAMEKSNTKGGFYIGLSGIEWPEMLLTFFEIKKGQRFLNVRKKVPPPLRSAVWEKFIQEKENAKCPFCKEHISPENFEVGHDLTVSKGGGYDINNLFPICGKCNKIMSTDSFKEMCQKNNFNTHAPVFQKIKVT
jgi:hypothetical protein